MDIGKLVQEKSLVVVPVCASFFLLIQPRLPMLPYNNIGAIQRFIYQIQCGDWDWHGTKDFSFSGNGAAEDVLFVIKDKVFKYKTVTRKT